MCKLGDSSADMVPCADCNFHGFATFKDGLVFLGSKALVEFHKHPLWYMLRKKNNKAQAPVRDASLRDVFDKNHSDHAFLNDLRYKGEPATTSDEFVHKASNYFKFVSVKLEICFRKIAVTLPRNEVTILPCPGVLSSSDNLELGPICSKKQSRIYLNMPSKSACSISIGQAP